MRLLNLLILVIALSCQVGASTFDEARSLLNQKKSLEALRKLQPSIQSYTATAGEWQLYAIANWDYFREDSLASSIKAATMAFRLHPSKETRQLKEWLEQKIPQRIEPIAESALLAFPRKTVFQTPPEIWVSVLLVSMMALFGSLWLRSHNENNRWPGYLYQTKTIVITGCVVLIIFSASWWQRSMITEPVAFVTQSGVSVFFKPDLSAKEIASVSVGTEVKPLNTFGKWQEVRLPDGRSGWIQSSVLHYLILE